MYDFKPGYLESMKCLCEAMAQECFWKMAVQDKQYKNGLVAKLSLMVNRPSLSALSDTTTYH